MKLRRRCHRCAMTLLEVVIAIALIALLMGALLTFFVQTTEIRDKVRTASARTQIVQQVLGQMRRELQAAVAMDQVRFPNIVQFMGDRRSITFLTAAPLPIEESYAFLRDSEWSTGPQPRQDLRQITYRLWIDPQEETEDGEPLVLGLLRTERRVIDPVETEETVAEGEDLKYIRHDLQAPELGYLEFRYFDGAQWSTTWRVAQGNRLPHLIQVTVGYDSLLRDDLEDKDLEEYPLEQYPLGPEKPSINRFTTLVRLPAADELFSARLSRLADDADEVYQTQVPTQGTGEGAGDQQPSDKEGS